MVQTSVPFFFLIFLIFLKEGFCSEYLQVAFHKDSECQSLESQWIFPFRDECFFLTFLYESGEMIRFDIDIVSEKVNYSVFCNFSFCYGKKYPIYSMVMVSLNSCEEYMSKAEDNLFVNFGYLPESPVNVSTTKEEGWSVKESFFDQKCTNSSGRDFGGEGIDLLGLRNGIKSGENYLFNDEYIFAWLRNPFMQFETVFLPRSTFDGRCSHALIASENIRFHCLSEEEAFSDDFLGQIPEKSFSKYVLVEYSFNVDCRSSYYATPYKTDECDPYGRMFHSSENVFFVLTFRESENCQGGIASVNTWKMERHISISNEPVYGKCLDIGYHLVMGHNVKTYRIYKTINDPYVYPSRMVNYWSTDVKCGDDLDIIEKDPSGFHYLDQEFCGGVGEQVQFENLPNEGRSFKGYCSDEDSKLYLNVWKTDDCFGEYEHYEFFDEERGQSELCGVDSHSGYMIYDRLMCIHRYCGGISELNPKVCNEVGKCEGLDYCICRSGYTGSLCESWNCYGLDRNEISICSGHGDCLKPDDCVCDEGYSGENCVIDNLKNIAKTIIVPIVGGIVAVGGVLVLFCCICSCCCCCSAIICFCTLTSVVCGISLLQKRKIDKYEQLEDFDIILKEQLMERDSTVAHLKIKKDLFEIPMEEIEVKRMIGKGGSSAVVFRASWKGAECAFKCFKTRSIWSSQVLFDQFEAELNILASLSHPNIIRFFGASLKPPRVGILMEYCEKGDLWGFIMKYRNINGSRFPIREKIRMFKEIISAIEFIHSRKIIHRDIKPDNVLVDSKERAKLMDFGISKFVENADGSNTCRVGTSYYMAPEVLTSENYDNKVDSFSFAILVWMIITEEMPYDSDGNKGREGIEFVVANDDDFRPSISKMKDSFLPEKTTIGGIGGEKEEEKKGEGGEEENNNASSSKSYDWIVDVVKKCWAGDPRMRYSFSELSEIFKHEKV